jgi:hypothetical protein
MTFAKRRHSIQIPQDYNHVPVRHSVLSFISTWLHFVWQMYNVGDSM